MNPNCPDPSYPEWDEIAQGCKAIAHTIGSSNPIWLWVTFGVIAAAIALALRCLDAR